MLLANPRYVVWICTHSSRKMKIQGDPFQGLSMCCILCTSRHNHTQHRQSLLYIEFSTSVKHTDKTMQNARVYRLNGGGFRNPSHVH